MSTITTSSSSISAVPITAAAALTAAALTATAYWYRVRGGGASGHVVRGTGLSAFPRLAREYEALFAEGREKGSQLAVVLGGRVVVDVAGGRTSDDVFRPEQMTMLFSSTKVIESTVVAVLADKKLIAYDDKLVKYVDGFYSPHVTVSDLMRYRAGCAVIEKPMSKAEAIEVFNDPAKTAQWVVNNTSRDYDPSNPLRQEYHSWTRGMFVACIVHKTTGLTMEQFVQRYIVEPVRAAMEKRTNDAKAAQRVELHIGVPPHKQDRMAVCEPHRSLLSTALEVVLQLTGFVDLFLRPSDPELAEVFHRDWLLPWEVTGMRRLLQSNPPSRDRKALILAHDVGLGAHYLANDPEFRAIPLSSATGASNAYSMAAVLGELAMGGGAILSKEGLRNALESGGQHLDDFLGVPAAYAACGWGLDRFRVPEVEHGESFVGWGGAGGSVVQFNAAWAPGVAFAYIPTKLESRTHKPNGLRLLKALALDLQEMGWPHNNNKS